MKKVISSVIALSIAVLALSGCVPYVGANTSSTANTASGESQVSTDAVRLQIGGSQEEQSILKDIGNAYKENNPGKNYEAVPTILGPVNVKSTLAKGIDTLPDVFAFSAEDLPDLVKAGALLPVADEETVKKSNTVSSIEAATVDGKLYAYPSSTATYVLYYNKNLLTAEEVQSLEGILSKNINGVTTNFGMNFTEGYFTSSFFLANGCTLYGSDGRDPANCDFSSEAGLEAGKALIRIATDPKAANLKDDDIVESLRKGTLAAAVSGTWNEASISSALGDNYGVVALPTVLIGGADKPLVSLGNLTFYGVKATTKNPDAAQGLAVWLTNKSNQLLRTEKNNHYPTNSELLADNSLNGKPMVIAQARQGVNMKVQPIIAQKNNFAVPFQTFGAGILDKSITEANLSDSLEKLNASLLSEAQL